MVSSTPRAHFTPGKDPVPILQKAGWAPGPVWTGGISRPHRDWIPDRLTRSQSLYRLSYRTHNLGLSDTKKNASNCLSETKSYLVTLFDVVACSLSALNICIDYSSLCVTLQHRSRCTVWSFGPCILVNTCKVSILIKPTFCTKIHFKTFTY